MGWHQAKLAVLLAHRGLLRVGELLRLRFCDIVLSGVDVVLLRLRQTKTGKEQPVRFTDRGMFLLLKALLETVKDYNEFVVQIGYARLRLQLRQALQFLGLRNARFVFHSLRHGGATELFQAGWALDNIAHQGRWRSLTTTRRYINTGLALLAEEQLSRVHQARAQQLAEQWRQGNNAFT